MHASPSSNLHLPRSARRGFDWIQKEILGFAMVGEHPHSTALRSIREENYMVGIYEDFGDARYWREIHQDLHFFLSHSRRKPFAELTYWAVYLGEIDFTENEFEASMWNELSHLSAIEKQKCPQGGKPDLCIRLEDELLHVAGLYPASTDPARRFYRPALVFRKF
jgi:uncharacterized protein